MRRVLLNSATVLSLLVCLAGIVTWGRSYEVSDEVHIIRGLRSVSVISEGGSCSSEDPAAECPQPTSCSSNHSPNEDCVPGSSCFTPLLSRRGS